MVWLLTCLLFLQSVIHTLSSGASQYTAVGIPSFYYCLVSKLQQFFSIHSLFIWSTFTQPNSSLLFRLLVLRPSEVLKTQHKYANHTSNLSLSAYCAHLLTAWSGHFPIGRKTNDKINLVCQFDKWILKILVLCLLSTMQWGAGKAL